MTFEEIAQKYLNSPEQEDKAMKSELSDEVEELAAKLQDLYQTKSSFKEVAKYVLVHFKYRTNAMWICDQIDGFGALCDKILMELDKIQCRKTRKAILWHFDMVLTLRSKELERRINDATY